MGIYENNIKHLAWQNKRVFLLCGRSNKFPDFRVAFTKRETNFDELSFPGACNFRRTVPHGSRHFIKLDKHVKRDYLQFRGVHIINFNYRMFNGKSNLTKSS